MPKLDFQFVPFGESTSAETLSVDGVIDGAGTHASHWAGNRTPPEMKADTATEIALNFARRGLPPGTRLANNHFDADGALAVFALLEPEIAARHAELIIAAAEAGDFDEWPRDERGLRLAFAIRALADRAGGEPEAYALVLPALPDLLGDLDAHRDLWEHEWDALIDADGRASRGALHTDQHGGVALLIHGPGVAELPGPVLSRRTSPRATRRLLAFDQGDGTFHYLYERPRWAWADTVVRPRIPPPSRNALGRDLGAEWTVAEDLGMTGILRTTAPVRREPADIIAVVLRADAGAR